MLGAEWRWGVTAADEEGGREWRYCAEREMDVQTERSSCGGGVGGRMRRWRCVEGI